VHRGYWIDIGTPEKYRQVHRDILTGAFPVSLDGGKRAGGNVHPSATVDPAAELEGPFYIGPGCRVEAGAAVRPGTVLVEAVHLAAGAEVEDSVLWKGCTVGPGARLSRSLLGPGVTVGRSALVKGTVLGEGSLVSDFSQTA
jgi:NDP-sugar pyrophosphorylase family protein